MDDRRVDALFARYVEELVIEGAAPGANALAEGDAELVAALEERIAAFQALERLLGRAAVPLPGKSLGPYQVLEPIGAGGMGDVYRARDTRLGREVALKVLPPLFALDPRRRARFEREARLVAAVDHASVAAIYAVERVDDVAFLVLELVRGETLAERIAHGPLPLREALPLLRDVASALEAAHERGIVHRDLKPANVKLTPEGRAKVLDFGLGKELGVVETPPLASIAGLGTDTGLVLGTPAYMSPEQARGREVDARTDVWSFGCVVYEALAGRPAFPGETFSDVVAAVVEGAPNWTALPAATPEPIRTLLRKCLAKERGARLGGMAEARATLEGALELGAARRRWVRPAAAASFVALALGAAWVAAWSPPDQPPRSWLRLVSVAAGLSIPLPTDAEAYRDYLRTTFLRWQESRGALRDGPQRPIYEAAGEPPEFWVIDGATGEVSARAPLGIRDHRRYFGPYVTPDGTRSYISVWGPTGRLIPIDNSRRGVMDIPDGGIPVGEAPIRMAFSPDGRRGYVTALDGVVVVDTDPTSPTFHDVLTVSDGRAIRVETRPFGIVITADGRRAYVSNQRSDSVSVIDTDPASPRYHTALRVPGGRAIQVGLWPRGLALDPTRARLYVANERDSSIAVIDVDPRRTSLHTVMTTVSLANGSAPVPPQGMTLSGDGSRIYAPCVGMGLVVIDATSLSVAARIPTGGGMKLALSEDGRRGFLLTSRGVTVLDTDPTSATLHQIVATLPASLE